MKPSFARFHLEQVSRRDALKLGAAGAAAVASAPFLASPAVADSEDQGDSSGNNGSNSSKPGKYGPPSGSYDDTMFDVEAVLAGAWDNGPYGPGDQRGTFNELTPSRTAKALRLLHPGRPVRTYQLGEEMFNGFPAFPSDPPRLHDMFLYVLGFTAPPGFVDGGGIQAATDPIGPNKVAVLEERFAENFTFQIATQIDGLNHLAVGEVFYNGHRGPDIVTPTGTSALGNENMGPVATRAVIYDVVGLKVATGKTDDFFVAPNGQPVLRDDYRITLDDLRACLQRQNVEAPGPGDVPILHTGWTHLVRSEPERYLTQEPGIFLEECRYFADRKVALVASDTWGLEVLTPAVTGGNAFPCHQLLIVKEGIRIGESFVTDDAVADHCYEGVLVATPENVPGATCGSSPPVLLGQPGRKPRD
ncbi:MAG: cyclase family protein [Acidimicrobiia bacterium]|nr:cyclase family protein [Acidimicrobiia bacterium]